MLLVLLTRILIWVAVGFLIYWILLKFIPKSFLTWFGGAILLALVVLSFVSPNDQTINTIWNIISLPLSPLGAVVILLLFALSEGVKKVKGQHVMIALLILLLSSIPLISRTLVAQAEQAVSQTYAEQRALCTQICPVDLANQVPLQQVVSVVMVGNRVDTPRLTDSLPSQVDTGNDLDPMLISRINSAATIYARLGRQIPLIVTAGPSNTDDEAGIAKDQALRRVLANNGVPAGNIRITNSGMDMHQTAEELKTFLQETNRLSPENTPPRDANRVILVAPALSMRRAALTFEQAGLQVIAWPTDLYGFNRPDANDTLARLADLVPSVEALRLTTRYWEELLTSIYYFLRGWLPGFNVQWDKVVETVQ